MKVVFSVFSIDQESADVRTSFYINLLLFKISQTC